MRLIRGLRGQVAHAWRPGPVTHPPLPSLPPSLPSSWACLFGVRKDCGVQVRDYVRRRRWIRSRVRKPAEQQPGTAASSASTSPIFGQSAPIFATHGDSASPSSRSLTSSSRPNLAKVSTTSSTGTGPIFNRPSGMFATHDAPSAANASFSSQRSGYAGSAGHYSPTKGTAAEAVAASAGSQPQLGSMREGSSHMLGGVQPSRPFGQDDRPYMHLSEVRQGLSTECNKWGTSVVSELHKAISSTGDGEHNLHCTGCCLNIKCNAVVIRPLEWHSMLSYTCSSGTSSIKN